MTSGKFTPNRIKIFSNRAMVYLNGGHGGSTLIDIEDVDRVREAQPWIRDRDKGYAIAPTRTLAGTKTTMLLHRFISKAPKGVIIDHINRNKLDNRKENLRFSDRSQNHYNSTFFGDDVGVGWHKRSKSWRAYITVNGRQIHLGNFKFREDALGTRYAAEVHYFGVPRPRKETDRC